MLTITGSCLLTVENGSYQLRLDHHSNAELIAQLGTSTLPLPFGSAANPATVLAHVRQHTSAKVRMAI